MDYDTCRSLPAMFFAEAEQRGNKPFLWAKRAGSYEPVSWEAAARAVRRAARGLRSLGIGPGERVGLVSENRPEWVIADLAIMSAGAVTVPAYVTNGVEDHRHVFDDSGLVAVIVSKPALSARVLAAANQVDSVQTVVAIEPAAGQASSVDILPWDELLARGAEQVDDTDEIVATLAPDDIACLIYTSGTGGAPKGVMTTHRNILSNCHGAYRLLQILGLGDEVFLELSAAIAFLRTYGRDDVSNLARRADLFRRRGGNARRQPHRGAADDHDRCAPPLRDAAPAHPARGRA